MTERGPVRAPVLVAALALLLAGACVTETKREPDAGWTLTAEPEVLVGGQPAPLLAQDAQQAQDTQDTQDAQLPPDVPAVDGLGELDDQALISLLAGRAQDELDHDLLAEQPPSPFHRLGRNTIRGIDGSWSKLYTLQAGMGLKIVEMLKTTVPGFPELPSTPGGTEADPMRWVLHPAFHGDPTEQFGMRSPRPSGQVSDVLVVTAEPEVLLFIDELLHKVLADLPQIELEVRIVEVNLDDLIEWNANLEVSELEDRSLPFDPTTNPPEGHFGSGVPILDPDGDPTGLGAALTTLADTTQSVSSFLVSLQGVHNNLRVDAILSFLQTINAAQLISAPTVTVLNGHRARLNTGDRVPIFEATGVGTNAQVTTRFEDTGVNVEIVPYILGDDMIRIDVSVEVSLVTGQVPFVLSGVLVSTPVISERKAGTTVHVHSGQVFSIGGLRSSTNLETISKVPLLGDLPLVGWLFKSRASTQENSEIVFFITPRVKVPSETLFEPVE